MFYFGRIISAFFNQLFRFLLWNKLGQKLLIILIISLIAFWCVGITKVHAVEEVSEVNYEVRSYYDGLVDLGLLRLDNYIKNNPNSVNVTNLKSGVFNVYFYSGNLDGSSYNNARPMQSNFINVAFYNVNTQYNLQVTNYDYLGVTGYPMYTIPSNIACYQLYSTGNVAQSQSLANFNIPLWVLSYQNDRLNEYLLALRNGNEAKIVELLEDIKAEQQATNDFLNEETDESNMVIDTPSVTDAASDNMSNNLHNQINTLTTNLQTTVSNYYEGQDAYTWKIPWPSYIGGYLTFDSGVTRRIIGTSGVVYNVIQAIWVVLFGGYIVGFIKRMLDWIQTGKIFDEGGLADFIWWMDTNNEIIKASMM